MRILDWIYRIFLRFRYPVTLPEDVADALGIHLSNYLTFEEFFNNLASPSCRPTKLIRYMARKDAEGAFGRAKKESFPQKTVVSYYFNEGWMAFVLQFDEQSRLRRIYLQHRQIKHDLGIEIPLQEPIKIA